ncbi:hypothetical protein K488DRAFT_63653 [Vararia minispora EC-137]|uniref:Uncharacterized protein n=1 Tax=Vararia minispora EC-137 TaxID=1314806 RepID=A0ACB8Q5A0_9AGAM|nr:hypothetical protein K488DRAFT_63653 [Vararia minispora EC-137]
MPLGGLNTYLLLDSGSTGSSLTPEFVRVSGLHPFALEEPIPLFLGCADSRSTIQFGATASVDFGPVQSPNEDFDVVNIDRYDGIIGVPFLKRHRFVLDFAKWEVRVNDHVLPLLQVGEEAAILAEK